LQVKLCDPRLSALSVVATIEALYKFTSFLSFKQNLETHGMSSRAGSFIFVMGKERADFAAVSALSLPWILT